MFASIDGASPGYVALAPSMLAQRHVSPPSILGKMSPPPSQSHSDRPSSPKELVRMDGNHPECMAKTPSTSRYPSEVKTPRIRAVVRIPSHSQLLPSGFAGCIARRGSGSSLFRPRPIPAKAQCRPRCTPCRSCEFQRFSDRQLPPESKAAQSLIHGASHPPRITATSTATALTGVALRYCPPALINSGCTSIAR
jgi:hypothetical protein